MVTGQAASMNTVVWSRGTKDVWVHLDLATVVGFFDIS